MKRLGASLFGSSIVPLTVLFVLTAGPARLYAEAAAPPPACEGLQHTEECTGLEAGASCTRDAGTGVCFTSLCWPPDASATTSTLQCLVPVVPPGPDAEAGDPVDATSADATGDEAAPSIPPQPSGAVEAGADTEDATTPPGTDSNGTPTASNATSHDDGGCSMPAGAPAGSAGAFFGALLAAGALWRHRRRAAASRAR